MLGLLWNTGPRRYEESAEAFAYTRSDKGDLPKLWQVPSFALADQHHRPVTLDALRGAPFIADFIFTQCTSACPMLTSRMVMLQRSLAGVDVRFVSFSVDPAHDTPDVLAAYAARWNERETRWALLANTDASLADITPDFGSRQRGPTTRGILSCIPISSSWSMPLDSFAVSTRVTPARGWLGWSRTCAG